MCYSAMVEQQTKKYDRFNNSFKVQVRVQLDMYDDIFQRRLDGQKIVINKAMERQFTENPRSAQEKAIADKIRAWYLKKIPELEKELFSQKKRLADAIRTLETKATKKAENDKRIATSKIEKLKFDLDRHKTMEIQSEAEERIFPSQYMSMLCLNESGEPIVMPVRYLLRPNNKDEKFDVEFNGCYNARLDSLDRVPWWKSALGKRHGLIMVRKFYENVALEDYGKKFNLPTDTAARKNLVLCFEPDNVEYMFIPTLWDVWERQGQPKLYSAALITDEPAPEIAEAGHDRTPIFLKESAVANWLSASGTSVKALKSILDQREYPHYSHRVVGAA